MPSNQSDYIEELPVIDRSAKVVRDADAAAALQREVGAGTVQDAREATEDERKMTLMQALRLYPKAVGWSVLLSTAIIMEGFDVVLIGSFYALPQFQQKYGVQQPDGSYNIPARWQTGLSAGAQVGEILGLFLNGIIAERCGYRKTMIGALGLTAVLIFIPFFAPSIEVLLVGEILMGIPWGVFQTLTTSYAAEVCPTALRAYLATFVNLAWVIGQLLASGVLRGVLSNQTEWAYRIPFALQWVWPIPLLIGCIFAPESPWWLVRHDRIDEARQALQRLTSPQDTSFDPEQVIAMIVHTNALEKSLSAGTSYLDCFRGSVNLRRTEIVCVVWAIQNLCGSAFMAFSTFFYERAGLATSYAFDMSLAQYALGAMGTVVSWFTIQRFGRRTLYVVGLALLASLLLIIGILGAAGHDSSAASWAIGSCLLVYTAFYDASIGPVAYALVAELSSTRLRPKTIVLARNCYNIVGLIILVIFPLQMSPDGWNWGAKTGFFWSGSCFLCFLWTYFRLPEPKNRTYGELDVLFERRISARKFSSTVVDQFAEGPTPFEPRGDEKAEVKKESSHEHIETS